MVKISERNELILYAIWDSQRGRYYVDVAERVDWAPPEGSHVICGIDREDHRLMLDWAIQLVKLGWPLEKICQVCEGKKTQFSGDRYAAPPR